MIQPRPIALSAPRVGDLRFADAGRAVAGGAQRVFRVQEALAPFESNVFRQEGDYWTIAHEGTVLRLKDAKGLPYLAHLLRHPGQEFPAPELVSGAGGPGGGGAREDVVGLSVRATAGGARGRRSTRTARQPIDFCAYTTPNARSPGRSDSFSTVRPVPRIRDLSHLCYLRPLERDSRRKCSA